MKSTLFSIIFFLYFISCTAQIPDEPMTIGQYPSFYANTINKMDAIIPNKTNYYGQPLSIFLQALNQNNLIIKDYNAATFSNKTIEFSFLWNRVIYGQSMDHGYVHPYILVYLQQPYNFQQATAIFNNSYHSHWNTAAENFYKDLIIEKIEFWYVRGLTDKSNNPK